MWYNRTGSWPVLSNEVKYIGFVTQIVRFFMFSSNGRKKMPMESQRGSFFVVDLQIEGISVTMQQSELVK